MKFLIVACLIGAAVAQNPGQCKSSTDCKKYGSDFTCIAVQTNYPGIALASQCVKGSVTCGGNTPGPCPTFSSWSSSYQKIQPMCALANVTNCDEGSGSKNVNCYKATFTVGTDTAYVNGIYKCVDSNVYSKENLGALTNLTQTQLAACAGNQTTSGGALCNGHGTCAPKSPFSATYGCICNAGYSVADNCNIATSNVCDQFGSCGSGNSCNAESKECQCASGTKGNQCSLCDNKAPSSDVCSGNGKCSDEGVCTCNKDYTGSLCAKYAPAGSSSGSTKGTNTKSSSDTISVSMASVMLATVAAIATSVV